MGMALSVKVPVVENLCTQQQLAPDMNEAVNPRCDPPGWSRAGDVVDGWHPDIRGLATAWYAIRRGAASN